MGGVHIDAQDFSQKRIRVLSVALRVAAAAAVSEANVKKAVFAESESAAIVIRKRLIQSEENIFSSCIGEICIGGGSSEFGDDALQLPSAIARVIYEETTVV